MSAAASPTARAAPAPAQRPRPATPATRPERRPRRRRLTSSVLGIGLVGLLLAGIVAVNVAVLRLNLRLDELSRERARLRADNAALAAKLSSAAGALRIQNLAATRLGLVPADDVSTTYVRLGEDAR